MSQVSNQLSTRRDAPRDGERSHAYLLGSSIVLTALAFSCGLPGLLLLPFGAIGFLISMVYGVFLVSRYPTIRSIRWETWFAYGISLIGAALALTYGLGQAELYVAVFVVIAVVFTEIIVLSWRANQLIGLFQLLLTGIGLVLLPMMLTVREDRFLLETVREGRVEHARFLLRLGADAQTQNSVALITALRTNISQPGDIEMLRVLLEHGADPNTAANSFGTPVLAAAVIDGRMDMVQLLLAYGADPNRDHSSALFAAVSKSDMAMIRLLLDHGADIHARDERGWSLLFVVRTEAVARFLIEQGVALDVRDKWGQTALFEVVQQGNVPTVALLVEHGLDINAPNNAGRTPLMAAAGYNGRAPGDKTVGSRGYRVVQYLIEQEADIRAVDDEGRTALDVAQAENYHDIVTLLRAAFDNEQGDDTNIDK
jgi:ankyrin repeat protein